MAMLAALAEKDSEDDEPGSADSSRERTPSAKAATARRESKGATSALAVAEAARDSAAMEASELKHQLAAATADLAEAKAAAERASAAVTEQAKASSEEARKKLALADAARGAADAEAAVLKQELQDARQALAAAETAREAAEAVAAAAQSSAGGAGAAAEAAALEVKVAAAEAREKEISAALEAAEASVGKLTEELADAAAAAKAKEAAFAEREAEHEAELVALEDQKRDAEEAGDEWEAECKKLEEELEAAGGGGSEATEAAEAAAAVATAEAAAAKSTAAKAAKEAAAAAKERDAAKQALEGEKRKTEQLEALLRQKKEKDGAESPSRRTSSVESEKKKGSVPARLASFASSIGSDTSSRRDEANKAKTDKRSKRVAKMKEKEAGKRSSNGAVLGLIPLAREVDVALARNEVVPGTEPLTGWPFKEVAAWNALVTTFDELWTEVAELSNASASYKAGLEAMTAGEADLAETFLRMASAKHAAVAAGVAGAAVSPDEDAAAFKDDARHFLDVCKGAGAAVEEQGFVGEIATKVAELEELRARLESAQEPLQRCEELRLELAHYTEKLAELGAGAAKKSMFGGSKEKSNEVKKQKILNDFVIFSGEAKRILNPLRCAAKRVELLEGHFADAERLHMSVAITLANAFDDLKVRGAEEEEEDGNGEYEGEEEYAEGAEEEYYEEDEEEYEEGDDGEYGVGDDDDRSDERPGSRGGGMAMLENMAAGSDDSSMGFNED